MNVSTTSGCNNCAGTGTTIIAIIALLLIIIIIIIGIILYFYPTNAALLEVRGVNFIVIPGTTSGGTNTTNETNTTNATNESLITGSNYLYVSRPLTGAVNLTILPNNRNFRGMTIGIKNTSPSGGGVITLVPGSGITLDSGGLDLTVHPGDFAWMVVTTVSPQTFLRLTMVT